MQLKVINAVGLNSLSHSRGDGGFYGGGSFYSGCLLPLFSMYADLYPLENGGIDVAVTSLHRVLSRASSLPCDYH